MIPRVWGRRAPGAFQSRPNPGCLREGARSYAKRVPTPSDEAIKYES